jgi:hypothetical protein
VKHSVQRGSRYLLGLELSHAVLCKTIAEIEGHSEVVSI